MSVTRLLHVASHRGSCSREATTSSEARDTCKIQRTSFPCAGTGAYRTHRTQVGSSSSASPSTSLLNSIVAGRVAVIDNHKITCGVDDSCISRREVGIALLTLLQAFPSSALPLDSLDTLPSRASTSRNKFYNLVEDLRSGARTMVYVKTLGKGSYKEVWKVSRLLVKSILRALPSIPSTTAYLMILWLLIRCLSLTSCLQILH